MNTQHSHKKSDPVTTPYMGIVECLQCIVDHGKHNKALNYCVNYAKHGIEIYKKYDEDMNADQLPFIGDLVRNYRNEMRMQLLYVLNNMTHWRGETASNVRVNLRKHMRGLEDVIEGRL